MRMIFIFGFRNTQHLLFTGANDESMKIYEMDVLTFICLFEFLSFNFHFLGFTKMFISVFIAHTWQFNSWPDVFQA